MHDNRLLDPIPVRFHPDTKKRMTTISRRFKLRPSEIIRRAVDAKLTDWEQNGVIVLTSGE